MAYKYNPLLKYNLQKVIQQGGGEDTQKKVSKFFASIDELEVGEIGEYQGETSETFTRGYFYERKDAVTITELGTTQTYTFNKYLDAILNNELYHRQYYVSDNFTLTADKIIFLGCSISNNTFINVIMMGVDFLKCDNLDTYTRGQRTYYVYPFAQLINGTNTQIDYKNKLKVIDNKVYYKDTSLTFTQASSGANATIGMEIDTHYLYMWIPLFPGYIAFLLDSAKLQAAFTETLSNFNIVDSLQINSLSPSVSLTVNDYEFTDQTPYAQVDTQQDFIAQYFNLLSSNADAVLVSSNHWTYDYDDKPFPGGQCIVYLKDERKFIYAILYSFLEHKMYRCIDPATHEIFYLIGGAPSFDKEYTLDIISPSAQSFNKDDSMPLNSRQLLNFRTATTSLNGLMSAADKTDLTNFSTYFQKALVISSNTQAQGMFGAVYNITFITSININLPSTSIVIAAGSIGIYIPASTSTAVIISAESTTSTTVKAHHKVSGTWIN